MNKKEEILKIASKEFAKYGYRGVSLEKIAKKADISKAAIYYHFKNKNELFEEVIMPKLKKLIDEVYLCNFDDPRKELKCYICAFSKTFKKHPCFASLLAHEFVDGGRDLNDEIIKNLSKVFKRLVQILKRGQEKGIFNIENPFSIQLMIVSTLIMHQTTKDLRKRISKYIEIEINPDIKDIAKSLYKKVLKAISKE